MALGAVRLRQAAFDARQGEGVPIAEFLLEARRGGILDHRLLAAMEAVPRPLFLDGEARAGRLYSPRPQPIACGQSTTPPMTIARLLVALSPGEKDRVLEIGTGTGYLSAVLAGLVRRVYTIDRFRTLVMAAQSRFDSLGIDNITAIFGDGVFGWSDKAPFDRIVVTASAEAPPADLAGQLSTSGRLIMPIGPADDVQMLTCFERRDRSLTATPITPVRVAPLIPGKAIRL